jgi:peptidoglycan/xylan/chitin deacetylase (PgdA/CDA1 family)
MKTLPVLMCALLMATTLPCRAESATKDGGKAVDPYGILLKPIPDKLVVLTFDDACLSHATFVAPLLKQYGFGATFYVTMFGRTALDKTQYMSWEQVRALEGMGFEVGNHSFGHGYMNCHSVEAGIRDMAVMEEMLVKNKVSKPTTFCWPIYAVCPGMFDTMTANGYIFARGGHERAYRPLVDNPLDVPSFTFHDERLRGNKNCFTDAAKMATKGRIPVFTFHGVPDIEHPTVGVEPARFEELMKYLKDNQYTVISMRDVAQYVDAAKLAQLLAFRRTRIWGGVTTKGNRLYCCVDQLPADRKLTLPEMTTRISSAYFLADAGKKPLTVIRAATGLQTIVVPEFSPADYGDGPVVIVAELKGGPIATITDFVLPGLPEATISENEILVRVPLATDLTKLAPIYKTGSPQVTGKPASGTTHDFTRPQTYTVTAADGSTRAFVVKVTPTLGAVGISNPSFEKFDATALNEGDAEYGKAPSGAFWNFKQAKPGDEVGISVIAGVIGAPPAPDGTRHAAFIHGIGNGISQSVVFDKGNYEVSFDVVTRRGTFAVPLIVAIDGKQVFALEAAKILKDWNRYTSPMFAVDSGVHTLAFTLGEGPDGHVLMDNVVIKYCR